MTVPGGLDDPFPADGAGFLTDTAAAPLAGGAAGLRCAALFQLFLAAAVLPVGTVPSGAFQLAALWGLIVWTVTLFRRVRPAAGWLLAPYLLWVSFTAYLNAGTWLLN